MVRLAAVSGATFVEALKARSEVRACASLSLSASVCVCVCVCRKASFFCVSSRLIVTLDARLLVVLQFSATY